MGRSAGVSVVLLERGGSQLQQVRGVCVAGQGGPCRRAGNTSAGVSGDKLLVVVAGCLMSQLHASVSLGWTASLA